MRTERATILCEGGFFEETVIKLVSGYFNGANISRNIGLWKGEREASLRIEVLNTPDALCASEGTSFEDAALYLADEIRTETLQESVFVLHDEVNIRVLCS